MKSSNSIIIEQGSAARRQMLAAGCREQIVSLLWTRPVQLSLHIAKLSL